MRTRELGPPLRLSVSPERSELKRVRELVREYATARGADTEPIDIKVCNRAGALELRVRAGVAAAAGGWDAVESIGLRLIAELSDRFEIPFRPQGGFEIRASFSIGRP
jgi:hypothetical protein